jgi:hypothetical protein
MKPKTQILKWQNPLDFAQKIADNYGGASWVFLYSGLAKETDNALSYIALFPQKKIICDDFLAAEKKWRFRPCKAKEGFIKAKG